MIARILKFSIEQRYFVVALWLGVAGFGLLAALRLPIDAVPDVTTDQVQVNTLAPGFSPLEMENYVTVPIELALSGLPRKTRIRSISQFGLSQVTVEFQEGVDVYWARQLVLERLLEARQSLPDGIAPELAPISTGLGEIFHFTVENHPDSPGRHSLMELRTVLDWFIKPELRNVEGVIDVNSFGGYLKQYELLADPARLLAYGLPISDLERAVAANNSNVGGGYLESGGEQVLLRGLGLIERIEDLENVVIEARGGTPLRVRDVAEVRLGSAVRYGAATRDGRGETVMGIALLLKGENSRTVTEAVRQRLEAIQESLPEGVVVRPFYDRSELVEQTVATAVWNAAEGGLLVMGVLFLFLLQLRAGLIVSSVIPLSMLFAIVGMYLLGVSANLMSLGAIDFGLIVDAAVIIVENSVRRLGEHSAGGLSGSRRREVVWKASSEVRRASQFGELTIIAAYLPILSLAGLEGKMFRPMAFTVILALSGALLLSLTLVPALSAIFLRARPERRNPVVETAVRLYRPLLEAVLDRPRITLAAAAVLAVACLALFPLLGSEFLPELDEGAFAINHVRLKSASLSEGVRQATMIERALAEIPEVRTVVSRIGRPEIATDPMGPEMADTYVLLEPRGQWRPGVGTAELAESISERLKMFPGVAASLSQPIRFRMQELIEGVGARADVVVKIFGDDLEELLQQAEAVSAAISTVPGAADLRTQQISGLPLLQIEIRRDEVARHGINVADVQQIVQTAIAGTRATTVLEGFRRFDVMIRLRPEYRNDVQDIGNLLVSAPGGQQIPLSQLADVRVERGPAEVSRENGRRRISVEVNVRGRDIGSFVEEARQRVRERVPAAAGTLVEWGGEFEHLESGRNRLLVAVPLTFLLVFLLLFATFNSLRRALMVFTGIPFAVTGGILMLLARGMHLSMSAGIGFIAVSGVSVLNGIVLITYIDRLLAAAPDTRAAILAGGLERLRPILMTALVASLGFLPMALSGSPGAEVQRPLATVVIGGLITSTISSLLVLPALYLLAVRRGAPGGQGSGV